MRGLTRKRYQPLNVEQALVALRAGFKLTACGGCWFPSVVMHSESLNLPTSEVTYRAFRSMQNKGLITFTGPACRENGVDKGGIWVASDKAKEVNMQR